MTPRVANRRRFCLRASALTGRGWIPSLAPAAGEMETDQVKRPNDSEIQRTAHNCLVAGWVRRKRVLLQFLIRLTVRDPEIVFCSNELGGKS